MSFSHHSPIQSVAAILTSSHETVLSQVKLTPYPRTIPKDNECESTGESNFNDLESIIMSGEGNKFD